MYEGYTLASPCFFAMPSVLWQVPQVRGTLSGYTFERESDLGKMVCALPWQLVQG
jgi:peptide methionine sulfoxide reductase MsrA